MSTQEQDFQWTEALVEEYATYYNTRHGSVLSMGKNLMEEFKKEKGEKRSPEYEILKFDLRHVDPPYAPGEKGYSSEELLKWGAPIHSVKRLSDGEVFSVGDTVYYVDGLYPVTIIEFYQPPSERGEMWFYWSSFKETVKNLDNFKKQDSLISPPKKPLFTTEDGVDIYEETNNVYGVNTQTWEKRTLSLIVVPNINGYKWFAVEYNRDRYILLNKPLLSINEVINAYDTNSEEPDQFLEALNQLAKEKL